MSSPVSNSTKQTSQLVGNQDGMTNSMIADNNRALYTTIKVPRPKNPKQNALKGCVTTQNPDPTDTISVKTESAKTESAKTESAKTESVQTAFNTVVASSLASSQPQRQVNNWLGVFGESQETGGNVAASNVSGVFKVRTGAKFNLNNLNVDPNVTQLQITKVEMSDPIKDEILGNLKEINLASCKLNGFSIDLSEKTKVTRLSILNSNLENSPSLIGCQNLSVCLLNGNSLKAWPDLRGVESLQILNVSNNKLEIIPDELCNLPRTCKIEIDGNPLTQGDQIFKFLNSRDALRIQKPNLGPRLLTNSPDLFKKVQEARRKEHAASQNTAQIMPLQSNVCTFDLWIQMLSKVEYGYELGRDYYKLEQDEKAQVIGLFLANAQKILDFDSQKEIGQTNLVFINDMLDLASENLDFRKTMIAVMEESNKKSGSQGILADLEKIKKNMAEYLPKYKINKDRVLEDSKTN